MIILMEPVTSLTDLILTFIAGGIAWQLWRNAPRPLARRDIFWLGSFSALAIATMLGTIIHGVPLGAWHWPVWVAIRGLTIGAEICFFFGALYTVFGDGPARRVTPGVVAVVAFLLVALVFTHDYFMLFEALGIGGAAALYAFHYAAMGQLRSLSLPGSSVFFAAGAALQAGNAGFKLIWTFNGDDIFHLALMGALVFIAIGAHPAIISLDDDDLLRLPRPFRLPSLGIAGPDVPRLPWRALQALADRLPESARNFPRGPLGRN